MARPKPSTKRPTFFSATAPRPQWPAARLRRLLVGLALLFLAGGVRPFGRGGAELLGGGDDAGGGGAGRRGDAASVALHDARQEELRQASSGRCGAPNTFLRKRFATSEGG